MVGQDKTAENESHHNLQTGIEFPDGIDRRLFLKTAAAGTAVGLAGCVGGGGGNGSGGNGNGSGGSGSNNGSSGGQPSYTGQVPEANLEVGTVPHMAAVRDIMPQNTNQRMEGNIRRFENVRLIITALNSGDLDSYTNTPANLYFAQTAGGNNYKIVGPKVMGTDYYIVGHEDRAPTLKSFVDRPQELTFAINQQGNVDHLQVVGVYDDEGLDFNNASTVNIGGSSARISAFLSGRADGFTCHVEQFEQLQSEGEPVKLLAQISEYFPNFVQSCLAVPADSLGNAEFDAWTQAYVSAVMQANQRAMNDFEWVFEKAKQYQSEAPSREEARATWEVYVNEMNAWQYDQFPQEPFVAVRDMLTSSGQLDSEVDIDSMFEPRFARQAMQDLETSQSTTTQ